MVERCVQEAFPKTRGGGPLCPPGERPEPALLTIRRLAAGRDWLGRYPFQLLSDLRHPTCGSTTRISVCRVASNSHWVNRLRRPARRAHRWRSGSPYGCRFLYGCSFQTSKPGPLWAACTALIMCHCRGRVRLISGLGGRDGNRDIGAKVAPIPTVASGAIQSLGTGDVGQGAVGASRHESDRGVIHRRAILIHHLHLNENRMTAALTPVLPCRIVG